MSTSLINITNQTMSSLEIARLTKKRHDNVRRTAEHLVDKELITVTQTEEPTEGGGKPTKIFHVGKRDSFVLVARLSPEFTAALVDRWQELEETQQPKLPATYLEALEKLVESEKEKLLLTQENQKLNTIIDNEFGYCSILRASIFLGVHESTFSWRPLKKTTLGMNMKVKKVPSPRYGYQNLYPIKAFEICYPDYDFDDLTPELVEDKVQLVLTK